MIRAPLPVLALASLVAGCAEQTMASRGAQGSDGTLRLSFIGRLRTLSPNLRPDGPDPYNLALRSGPHGTSQVMDCANQELDRALARGLVPEFTYNLVRMPAH